MTCNFIHLMDGLVLLEFLFIFFFFCYFKLFKILQIMLCVSVIEYVTE